MGYFTQIRQKLQQLKKDILEVGFGLQKKIEKQREQFKKFVGNEARGNSPVVMQYIEMDEQNSNSGILNQKIQQFKKDIKKIITNDDYTKMDVNGRYQLIKAKLEQLIKACYPGKNTKSRDNFIKEMVREFEKYFNEYGYFHTEKKSKYNKTFNFNLNDSFDNWENELCENLEDFVGYYLKDQIAKKHESAYSDSLKSGSHQIKQILYLLECIDMMNQSLGSFEEQYPNSELHQELFEEHFLNNYSTPFFDSVKYLSSHKEIQKSAMGLMDVVPKEKSVYNKSSPKSDGLQEKQQQLRIYTELQREKHSKKLADWKKDLKYNVEVLQDKVPRKKNIFGMVTNTPGKFAQKIGKEHQQFMRLVNNKNNKSLVDKCNMCKEKNEYYEHCIKHYNERAIDNLYFDKFLKKTPGKLKKTVKKIIAQINPDNCEEKLKDIFQRIFAYLQKNKAKKNQYEEYTVIGFTMVSVLNLSNNFMLGICFDHFKSIIDRTDIKDLEYLENFNKWMGGWFTGALGRGEFDQRKQGRLVCDKVIDLVDNMIKKYQSKSLLQTITSFFVKKSEFAKAREKNVEQLRKALEKIRKSNSANLPKVLKLIREAISDYNNSNKKIDGYDQQKDKSSGFSKSLEKIKRYLIAVEKGCGVQKGNQAQLIVITESRNNTVGICNKLNENPDFKQKQEKRIALIPVDDSENDKICENNLKKCVQPEELQNYEIIQLN